MTDNYSESDRSRGGPPEFVRLFLDNERRIYAFIVSVLPTFSDADDVLQETSVVLWKKFDQFEPGTDFCAWAIQVARFEVLKFYKKQRRSRLWLSPEALNAVAETSIAQGPALEARQQALALCIQELNDRQRDLLKRRYANAASPQQIASQVGRSLHAIYKALERIHDVLLSCIQRKLAQEQRT